MHSHIENQILTTKLMIPNLPGDFIERPTLIGLLNKNGRRPATLVSAGSGFGKSTLISSWISELPCKKAWISLDENDNDLREFLIYFISAIQKIFPKIGYSTQELLSIPNLPPLKILTKSLINDLNNIPEKFIFVLDDFHVIRNSEIYEIFTSLLKHPPKYLHIVLITRLDPPLPLASLRSKNMLIDIRASNLRLSSDEIAAFLKNSIDLSGINSNTRLINILEEKTEGWITGLRLATLHLSYHTNEKINFEKFVESTNCTEEYFIDEVIEHLDDHTVEFLLKSSILQKFCAPLVDFILSSEQIKYKSSDAIERLLKENLFVIKIDEENNWFRYHNLFQDLLQKELRKRYSEKTIFELHKKAIEWYESNSYIDETLYHSLQLNNLDGVASFIEKYMHKPLNEDKWYVLEKWLKKLPDSLIFQHPSLIIAQIWVLNYRGATWAIPELLQMLDKFSGENEIDNELEIEIRFFKGMILFWQANVKKSLQHFSFVRKHLTDDKIGAKAVNEIHYSVAMQMIGSGKEVMKEYEKILYNEKLNSTYKTRVLGAIIFMHLLDGNLPEAERFSNYVKELSEETDNDFIYVWSLYLLGYIKYQQNKLEEAERFFSLAIEKVYLLDHNTPVDCFAGLLLTLLSEKKTDAFEDVYNKLSKFVNASNNPLYKTYSITFQIRLAILQNDMKSAEPLVETIDFSFDSGNTLFWIEIPRLTYCKYLIAKNTKEKLNEAQKKLNEFGKLAESTGNTPQLLRVLILQSIVYEKKNQEEKALATLDKALQIGQLGGWSRPFIEEGDNIKNLLIQLKSGNLISEFIDQILDEISDQKSVSNIKTKSADYTSSSENLSSNADELTNREIDVLLLLSKRLTNKEIAEQLSISPATVKRHTITIYQKLDVSSRREAAVKADKLGLIKSPI